MSVEICAKCVFENGIDIKYTRIPSLKRYCPAMSNEDMDSNVVTIVHIETQIEMGIPFVRNKFIREVCPFELEHVIKE
jgi:hypothetical protein